MSFTWDHETFDYADHRIRALALKIVLDLCLPAVERESIVSDLWKHLLIQMSKFKPGREPHPFIGKVIQRKAQDVFRSWWRGKNSHLRRALRLNEPLLDEDGHGIERQDLLTEDEYRRAMIGPCATQEDLLDQRIDLARRMARLSKEHRLLCLRLISETASAIARSDGVSRHVISERIRKIRRILGLIE